MTNSVYSLNDLRDIAMPEPVSFWPPAMGFWIIAGLGAVVLIHIILRKYKTRHASAYRRAGLLLLKEVGENFSDETAETIAGNISLILKRVALVAFPREQVASLTGDAWLSFLNESYGGKEFFDHPGVLLKDAASRPSGENIINRNDSEKLLLLAREWVMQHGTGEI